MEPVLRGLLAVDTLNPLNAYHLSYKRNLLGLASKYGPFPIGYSFRRVKDLNPKH